MSKYDYSKVTKELQEKIFDKLLEEKFNLDGLVSELCRQVIPSLSDSEKLARVRKAFGDAHTLFVGLPDRSEADHLAMLLGLPDCLPQNNDE